MLGALGLESLEQRREIARLTMMYKILNGYVAICLDDLDLSFADPRTLANHQFKLEHIYTALQKHFAAHLLQEQFQPGTDFLQTLQRPTR